MLYDTDSQSRNAPCVPLRGRGPRSGEGVDEGKNDCDTRCGRDRRRRHYKTHCPLKGKRLTTFCASLRSGGRRLAVRIAIEHPIGALPRTPFPASRDFPSRGNEKIGGTGYCVTYDTDSQSRNAPCVPFRGRGPQSGEGVDGGNPDYDTRCGRDRRRRHYKTHRPAGDTTTLGPKARQT